MRKLFLFLVVLFLSFQQLTLAAIKEMTSTPDSVLFCFLLQLPETTDAADSVLPGVQIKKIGLKLAGTTDISGAIIAAGDHRRKCSILI